MTKVTHLAPIVPAVLMLACAEPQAPRTHTYFVAADEIEWDYAPSGADRITGQPFAGLGMLMMVPGPQTLGRVYRKAVYHEYTDSTFAARRPREAAWEHLGMLGPLLRATVGDTIRVVFRNNTTRPASMHPHGVIYDKASEGAPYEDGTAGADKADDGVAPGGTHVYLWPVPERAGPGPAEGSSILWMYHSHHDEMADFNAGLVGPMIVTARGRARADGTPDDVDRELVVAFQEVDEIMSGYYAHNVRTYAQRPDRIPQNPTFADYYYLSNLKETINGFSFGHTPLITIRRGERVRWYVFGTGNFEVHAPHWHGQTALVHHMRTDVLSLLTMEMVVADMVPDNPGTWLFHCHVGPHLMAGMQALFRVD